VGEAEGDGEVTTMPCPHFYVDTASGICNNCGTYLNMTIGELLRGRGTIEQLDILQRADGILMPHVFALSGKDADHCVRCFKHRLSTEATWRGGKCEPWRCGRYYGGPLTPDEIAVLTPEKPNKTHRK
jgi:hypothetical protein